MSDFIYVTLALELLRRLRSFMYFCNKVRLASQCGEPGVNVHLLNRALDAAAPPFALVR